MLTRRAKRFCALTATITSSTGAAGPATRVSRGETYPARLTSGKSAINAAVVPLALLGLLLTATFFFNDLMIGPAWAACADIGERYAGTLSGFMNMTGAIAGACATALIGRLFAAGRADLMFPLFGASWLLAALCWLGVDVSRPISD